MDVEAISQLISTHFSGMHSKGCIPTLRKAFRFIGADLYRYSGAVSLKEFIKNYFVTPAFKYTTWMRLCSWAKGNKVASKTIFPFMKWKLLRLRYKYGFAIPEQALIGPGLFINRFGGIFVAGDSVIGCNVNITAGTLIGYVNRGQFIGAPIVGDNVFFGSGAKAIGSITIGDNSVLGVNAVMTKSAPPNSVIVGMPGKVISGDGSEGYINRAVSDQVIAACGWPEMLEAAARMAPSS